MSLSAISCATVPEKSTAVATTHTAPTGETINVDARKKYAMKLQVENKLHDAQIQWRILIAIDPNNAEYRNRLRVLQALINRRTKTILQQANLALEKNNIKEAERGFLLALTFDPFNAEALESLRALQRKHVLHQLEIRAAKNASHQTADAGARESDNRILQNAKFYLELGIQLFEQEDWFGAAREVSKYLSNDPKHEEAREYYSLAHFYIALKQKDRAMLESSLKHLKDAILYSSAPPDAWYIELTALKNDLAESYYIEGIQAMRSNIDLAIELWQKGLMHNPANDKIQARLEAAEQMKKSTSRIVDSVGE